jgi:hypothetical protein
MNKKHRRTFKYNDAVLKSGYEAMGKINLGFAESGLAGDAQDLTTYEQNLESIMQIESGDNDD